MKKGISLIVLVITIIIMIILSAAIILSLSNNGIIGNAKKAVEASDLATIKNAKAIIDAEIEIARAKGEDLLLNKEYNVYVSEELEKQGIDTEGYYFSQTSVIVVPKEFIVSDKAGENTVEKGLVIYQGTEKVSTDSDADTTRNQFVWIPVTNSNAMTLRSYRWDNTNKKLTSELEGSNAYSYPQYGGDLTAMKSEYENMMQSVKTNGGFYISRYLIKETADKKNISISGGKIMGDNRTSPPLNIFKAMDESALMAKNMGIDTNYVSSATYGEQYTAIIEFIKDVMNNNGNPMIVDAENYTGNFVKNIGDIKSGVFETNMSVLDCGESGGPFDSQLKRFVKYPASSDSATNFIATTIYEGFQDYSVGFRTCLYKK